MNLRKNIGVDYLLYNMCFCWWCVFRSSLSLSVMFGNTGHRRPNSLLSSVADVLPLEMSLLTRRLLKYSPVVLWQNLKPVFTFFYIDTDSNKCIFSPCNGWAYLWLSVFVCSPVNLTYIRMNMSARKSLFLFQRLLFYVFISSDSMMEIEMPYRVTTGEEFRR